MLRDVIWSKFDAFNSKIRLPNKEQDSAHVWHVFVIRCERRDELQKYLADHGVHTLIHYPVPPHYQKAYEEWSVESYPASEMIHQQVLSLPQLIYDKVSLGNVWSTFKEHI